ncbi:MAG TPA: efflux RND transporter periplasmic adaptor subunit [Terriglobales bacterium]|jgi:multidrug efflux pump subunit AcrA (membrane-fusion protein)
MPPLVTLLKGKTPKRIFVALLLSAIVATMVACSDEAKDTEAPVPVQIVQVERAALQQKVTAEAVLFPIAQSSMVPKISAPVQKFLVNRGSHVHKGQLLAVLENHDLAAAAQDSQGAYTQAQAAYDITTAADVPQQMQKAELDLQAARQAFDAQQKIYDSRQELFREGALPRKELEQSNLDLTNAKNQYEIAKRHLESLNALGQQQALKSAKGQLESAKGKYEGAEAQLNYSEIRAPISGVVTERPLYPGEMASAGTPLLTVMDISRVVARAHIDQSQAALLKSGDTAEVKAPGITQTLRGKVSLVSPALDPNSTTVEVWIELKNNDSRLRPGTNVEISVVAHSIPDALTIPAAALLTAQDGATSVMVAGADGRAHQRTVKTGVRDGNRVQIVDGVQDGERVVGSGAYGLPDNSKITAEQPTAEGKT